jgi:outer membrane protein, multidrug efflux system
MTVKSIIPAICLVSGLVGCAGPAVKVANVAAVMPPPQWRTDAGPVAAFDAQWWQRFGDPRLTTLVERGLANNSDIGVAIGRVREARAQERLAHSQFFPTLDAGLGAAAVRTVSPFGTPQESIGAQPTLQIAYDVDLFGRLADQSAAARNAFRASEAARDATRLSVSATIASGYITLCALDARRALAQRTLDVRREALRIARSRTRNGYSPMLELRQAEAEYQATLQIIPQAQLAIARQENSLSVLVGDIPGTVMRTSALGRIERPAIPAGMPSELLRRRPDVAQAEFLLAASDKSLTAARKRFLPQVRLTGSSGVALSSLLGDPIGLWSIGSSILAPLFEGGRLTAQAEGVGAQRDQAAWSYRRAVLNAFREVEDALAAAEQLADQQTAIAAQRDALSSGLTLATNRFRAGYAPYLEQLDAQRALLSAELSLIQIEADQLSNRVVLFQAMGGGYVEGRHSAADDKASMLRR